MIKNCKYLTFIQSIKCNRIQIKLDLDGIVLSKKSYISSIFFVIGYNIDFTNSKGIIKTKLLPKKQYIVSKIRNAYIVFLYQPKIFFDLFYTTQIVEFLLNNIVLLNKKL